MSFLPQEWNDGVDPEELSKETIHADHWDRQDLAKAGREIPTFEKARKDLEKFTPTGRAAENDAFLALLKAKPRINDKNEVAPSHWVNRTVAEVLLDLEQLRDARFFTVGDDVQAAMSAAELAPEIQIIFDRMKHEQQAAKELEDLLKEMLQKAIEIGQLEELLDELEAEFGIQIPMPGGGGGAGEPDPLADEMDGEGAGDGEMGDGEPSGEESDGEGEGEESESDSDGEGKGGAGEGEEQPELTDEQREKLDEVARKIREAQERLEEMRAEAENRAEGLEKGIDTHKAMASAVLGEALSKEAQAVSDTESMLSAWGLEPGDLRRLPAKERLEKAKKLNTERFRQIADLFGPMKNLMLSEQARKTARVPDELADIEFGDELSRLLPSELINLALEDAELDFLRRYTERGLAQYELQGEEKLARGGIIYACDTSGSMNGAREENAKAVMLALLHLARIQKRPMHIMHFGAPNQLWYYEFTKPEHFTLEAILDAAGMFHGGGTDFHTPMKRALEILDAEHAKTGCVHADVVFVTDDECWVDPEFMKEYHEEEDRMQFTTWGIVVASRFRPGGAIDTMTRGKVCLVSDLKSGKDMKELFRGVT